MWEFCFSKKIHHQKTVQINSSWKAAQDSTVCLVLSGQKQIIDPLKQPTDGSKNEMSFLNDLS